MSPPPPPSQFRPSGRTLPVAIPFSVLPSLSLLSRRNANIAAVVSLAAPGISAALSGKASLQLQVREAAQREVALNWSHNGIFFG